VTHIKEGVEIHATPQSIWGYVQDYHRRPDWDVTTAHFEPAMRRGIRASLRNLQDQFANRRS
jgi:hypothetical protein